MLSATSSKADVHSNRLPKNPANTTLRALAALASRKRGVWSRGNPKNKGGSPSPRVSPATTPPGPHPERALQKSSPRPYPPHRLSPAPSSPGSCNWFQSPSKPLEPSCQSIRTPCQQISTEPFVALCSLPFRLQEAPTIEAHGSAIPACFDSPRGCDKVDPPERQPPRAPREPLGLPGSNPFARRGKHSITSYTT